MLATFAVLQTIVNQMNLASFIEILCGLQVSEYYYLRRQLRKGATITSSSSHH